MGISKQALVPFLVLGASVLPCRAQALPSVDTVRSEVAKGHAAGYLRHIRTDKCTFTDNGIKWEISLLPLQPYPKGFVEAVYSLEGETPSGGYRLHRTVSAIYTFLDTYQIEAVIPTTCSYPAPLLAKADHNPKRNWYTFQSPHFKPGDLVLECDGKAVPGGAGKAAAPAEKKEKPSHSRQ